MIELISLRVIISYFLSSNDINHVILNELCKLSETTIRVNYWVPSDNPTQYFVSHLKINKSSEHVTFSHYHMTKYKKNENKNVS